MSDEETAGFTKTDLEVIGKGFNEIGVKPNTASTESFQKWLLEFAKGAKPKTEGATAHPATSDKSLNPYQPPRLPSFSGDKKGDATFDLWKYEVECLMKEKYTDSVIAHSIRRSVKGEAARVIMRLGSDASVPEILHKLESIFGTIDTKASVLSQFFSARQREDEDVSSWGCRLEDLMNKAVCLKQVKPTETNDMLRNMFYEGLKASLQDTTGYIFDAVSNFDELRRAVRRKEEEVNRRKMSTSGHVKQVKSTEAQANIEELKQMVQKLSHEVTQMRENRQLGDQSESVQNIQPQQSYNRGRGKNNRGRGNWSNSQGNSQNNKPKDVPVCYRCGQEGHIQKGCRVRLDHTKRSDLNTERPMSRRGH